MKQRFDLIIKDGLVYDGTGSPPFQADVAVFGDRIAAVGKFSDGDAAGVITANDLAVAPGFIDAHAHSDFTLLADPRAEGKILQGITTEINGNCGMSAAPLYGRALERRMEDLKELGITESWNSVAEYRGLMEKRGSAVNFAMLAGHGNIRGAVVGYDNREPTAAESSEMKRLLEESLRQGACGLSSGLIYPPGIYSTTEELTDLCRVLKPFNMIYTSHMRSEGAELLESIEEILTIAGNAGIRAHISHIKTAGEKNWRKVDSAISMLMDARSRGIEITCDRYPYTASATDLDSILPSWAFEGGNDQEIERLRNRESRQRLRNELLEQAKNAEYWQRVIISSVSTEQNRWMEGMTMADISSRMGADEINTLFNLLLSEQLRVGAIFLSMNEDNLRKFLSLPYCAIGSDSSARCFDGPTRIGKPHPRTFGTFPRFFGKYIRDENLIPLQEAVHKAALLPALVFGLEGRGMIREGMFADIVVFDPGLISDCATFTDPYQRPEGVSHLLVNGVPVVWEGRATGRLPGKMLSRSS